MLATIATILADKEEECQKRRVPPECLNNAQEVSNFLTERIAALMQLIKPDTPPVSISSLYRDENGKQQQDALDQHRRPSARVNDGAGL